MNWLTGPNLRLSQWPIRRPSVSFPWHDTATEAQKRPGKSSSSLKLFGVYPRYRETHFVPDRSSGWTMSILIYRIGEQIHDEARQKFWEMSEEVRIHWYSGMQTDLIMVSAFDMDVATPPSGVLRRSELHRRSGFFLGSTMAST